MEFDDRLDKIFNFPMLDCLIEKECTLNSLNVNPKAESTCNTTLPAVHSFNRFWNTREFWQQIGYQLFTVRYSNTAKDGFEALFYMFHNERNGLLSHYIVKLVPYCIKKDNGNTNLTRGANKFI